VVLEKGETYRDTMAATLGSDGAWIPPFYIRSEYANASKASGRRPEAGKKPVKGMTIQKMKEYADHLDKYVDEPSILVMDRLSSHTSKEIIAYFESKKCSDQRQKFKVMLLPAKGAFLISPLDFGFFGYWKAIYHKLDRSTPELKFWAANQAWKHVETSKVISFFEGTLLVGKQKESTLRKKLMSQVKSGIPEELEEVWDFYDGWVAGSYDVEGASALREISFEKPKQLLDSDLDGVYWNNWGGHRKK
jgi:hypothetical protein